MFASGAAFIEHIIRWSCNLQKKIAGASSAMPKANRKLREHFIAVAELTMPEPKAAYAYWLAKKGTRPFPSRADIQPTEIPKLLPYITLLDVIHEEPVDYRFRIEGDTVERVIGYRRMGRRLSELTSTLGPAYESAYRHFDEARKAAAPLAYRSQLTGVGRGLFEVEKLIVPLSNDGKRVDQLLRCIGILRQPTG
jgi:hypothetical protein